jgi:hypothetical protein
MIERRTVIVREGGDPIGTASLIALIVIAALIALFIWQPWNGTMLVRSTTVTTSIDGTSGTR